MTCNEIVEAVVCLPIGARPTLALVNMVQIVAFLVLPGLTEVALFSAALLVMLGVFGQVPVNDFLIGTTTSVKARSRAFGDRYLVSFTAFSTVLPLIEFIQYGWGFDGVFRALLLCPMLILISRRILLPAAVRSKAA